MVINGEGDNYPVDGIQGVEALWIVVHNHGIALKILDRKFDVREKLDALGSNANTNRYGDMRGA